MKLAGSRFIRCHFRRHIVIAVGLLSSPAAAFPADRPVTADLDGPVAAVHAVAPEAPCSADSRIISSSQAVVPVSIEAGAVIVEVSIDGRGPFPLMFDTGAQDTVTPETAAALGLKTEGSGTARDSSGDRVTITFTRVGAVRLGEAEMTDQPFAVLGLPRYVADRGSRQPLAGFIGWELLARFAARLDYDDETLTLTPGQDFRYGGQGMRIPLAFIGKTPVVP